MLRRGCQVPRGEREALARISAQLGAVPLIPAAKWSQPWPCFIPAPSEAKSPSISGDHSSVLDAPQPADAKPRICNTPACVQLRPQLDRELFGQQRADQLYSWLLIRARLGKQLAALPCTPEPDCQPQNRCKDEHRAQGSLRAGQQQPHCPASI